MFYVLAVVRKLLGDRTCLLNSLCGFERSRRSTTENLQPAQLDMHDWHLVRMQNAFKDQEKKMPPNFHDFSIYF